MTRPRAIKIGAFLIGLFLTLSINFHSYYTDLNLVPGDRGDTRLVVFTLEHWLNVFKGREAFYLLSMFFPSRLALGYADGLFLFALPYAVFRTLGFDFFTSYQLLFPCMTLIGYSSCLWLLRRALKLELGFAVLGSVLFSSLNAMQLQAEIGKMLGFYFYPALVGSLYIYFTSADKSTWGARCSLGLFTIGLGLLFFTSYYPAWFFLFTLLLFAVGRFAAVSLKIGLLPALSQAVNFAKSNWLQLWAALALFMLALVPFAITYAPLVLSNSHRSFDLVLDFSPSPKDIVNVSAQNYVWSPVLHGLHFKFGNREVQMGSPALVLILFVAFYVRQLSSRSRRGGRPADGRDDFVFLLSTVALAIVGLTLKLGNLSLWYIVYELAPGAAALRALGRYLMVVDMIVVVAVTYGLQERFLQFRSLVGHRRRYWLAGAALLLGAALTAEQLNATPFRLDKAEQLRFLQKVHAPPAACDAFFINNAPASGQPAGYYQLDAMMISMNLGLPTVNGYSGFSPSRAFDMLPAGAEYKYRVLSWLRQYHVDKGVCEFDYQSTSFRAVDVATEYPEYEQLYREGYLEAFSTLYSATVRFLGDKNDLSNLYPQYLEEHGYLDASWGFEVGPKYRWMQDRYWLGERPCGKDSCFGIGVVGTGADVRAIIEEYDSVAARIFFPEPQAFVPGTTLTDSSQGELLMLFPPGGSRP